MKIKSFVLLLCVVGLAVSATACGSKSPTTPTTVTSISVTGSAPAVGSTTQFAATATVAGGAVEDITTSATWSSSDPTIATVSSAGLVTGLTEGTVVISAVFSGISGNEQISVP